MNTEYTRGSNVGKVVKLITYKNERQFIKQYLENFDLVTELIQEVSSSPKPTKLETDRELQLSYMKMLTKRIENRGAKN